jgi:murein DD-endopeptidase MepM/ murein hydrolase activator NlpD
MTTKRPTFGRRRDHARIILSTVDGTREVSVGAGSLVGAGIALSVFAVAFLGSTVYLVWHDELLSALSRRQAALQIAYEDRIASLRAQIDRINSRQLIDQEAFEARIAKVMEQQQGLREHEAKVGAVLEKARQQGLKLPTLPATPAALPAAAPAAAGAAVKSSSLLGAFPLFAMAKPEERSERVAARVTAAERSVESLERRQAAALGALAELAERDARRIEKTVGRLGLPIGEAKDRADGTAARQTVASAGVGGPFVPALDAGELMARAEQAIDRLGRYRRSLAALPVRAPLPGNPAITSTFGNRTDPFLNAMAIHTGIDFRAETGDPVYATGAGTVSEAGRQGGYGNMVEIDHGNGIATRFGHLLRIKVAAGEAVKAGDLIGWAGSTGRSTGPHLHYETRVDGDAVNPQRWLEAGEELAPVLP